MAPLANRRACKTSTGKRVVLSSAISEGGTDSLRELEAVAGEAASIDKAGNRRVAVKNEVVVGRLAVMGEAVEQGGGHLGVAEHGGPSAEGEVGGDDDRGALVEAADQVEQQLAAGLCEGQIPNHSSKRNPEVGQGLKLRAHVGIQNPLHNRGLDHQLFA